jgi:orotate phosphoribosyltransferase
VILVEDIVDTGRTLKRLRDTVQHMGARTVATVALLNKQARRQVDVPVSHVGFECPNAFIVGCALFNASHFDSLLQQSHWARWRHCPLVNPYMSAQACTVFCTHMSRAPR